MSDPSLDREGASCFDSRLALSATMFDFLIFSDVLSSALNMAISTKVTLSFSFCDTLVLFFRAMGLFLHF